MASAWTPHLEPPFAVVDLDAFDANAADLLRRAGGTPIRLASKSVRCRALIERALAAGLAGHPRLHAARGAVAGRPRPRRPRGRLPDRRPRGLARARRRAVRARDADGRLRRAPRPRGAACAAAAARSGSPSTSTRAGGRSAAASASAPGARRYGRPSRQLRSRMRSWPGRSSPGRADELRGPHRRRRRPAARPAADGRCAPCDAACVVSDLAERARPWWRRPGGRPARFVNGGGTGSVERTAAEPAVTEVARARASRPDAVRRLRGLPPAARRALRPAGRAPPRRPASRRCSAAATRPRAPRAPTASPPRTCRPGLRLDGQEGAGEVQTPLRGPGARVRSATACGCATPRRGSCASASTGCT